MKKLLLVCVLAFAVAGTAQALPLYLWNVGGYNTAGGSGVYTFFGVQSAGIGTTNIAANSSQAAVGSLGYSGELGAGMVKTGLFAKSFVAAPGPAAYILQAWAGTDYVGDVINIRVWANTTATTLPSAGWALYKLYDPITQEWGKTKLGTIPVAATAGSIASPWFKVDVPVFRTGNPLGAGQGYILSMEIPEPGSVVAVLSGLVGLVGFGIRRKR